jgi:DNA-binding transcriptional ArsR family regulator
LKATTDLTEPALVRALAHPLRAQILGVLQERRASPRELADVFGAPLGNVSYHVRCLADLRLIKLVKKTPRRGAIEHHYEATSAAVISDSTWGKASTIVKKAMVASALEEIGRSVNEAAALGGFERREAHLSRSRLVLDDRGWAELGEALLKLIDRANRISDQSEKRLKRVDHQGERRASLAMMLFEDSPSFEGLPSEQHTNDAARKRSRKSKIRGTAKGG